MSKTKILQNISKALAQNPISNQRAVYTDIILPVEQDKIKEYKRLQEFNKAEIFETTQDQVAQVLQEILQKENIAQTLIPSTLQGKFNFDIPTLVYDKPMEKIKNELFSIECSILEADFGVANLGVIALTSSPTQPRLLSLITKHCIILLKKENVRNNLSEVLSEIKKNHSDTLPSNILFIAGPSRTADIELQVVFGVHGPQKVYVILF